MEPSFDRLLRFEAEDGSILYGDVTDASALDGLVGAQVNVLEGDLNAGFSKTSKTATVKKVRPLSLEARVNVSKLAS